MTTSKQRYYEQRRYRTGLAKRYARELADCRVVLDIGCGEGLMGAAFAFATVHGIDNDAATVEKARQYEHAIRADVSEGLPYPDSTFDGVVAKDILEHVERPWELVGEIGRVLKPGGTVLASVVQDRPRRVWADYTHVRGFSKKAARMLFEDAGFVVDAIWPMGGVPLTDRLGLIDIVPTLLSVPGLGALWAASWELRASTPR